MDLLSYCSGLQYLISRLHAATFCNREEEIETDLNNLIRELAPAVS